MLPVIETEPSYWLKQRSMNQKWGNAENAINRPINKIHVIWIASIDKIIEQINDDPRKT